MKAFVECYSGLMGGGKSFSAVLRMLDHIAAGGVVFSNIKLQLDPWYNYDYGMKEFTLPKLYDEGVKQDPAGPIKLPVFQETKNGREWVYNSRGAIDFLRRFRDWEYQEGQFNYLPDEEVGPDLMNKLPRGSVDRPVLVILDEALDHFESACNNVNAEFRSFLRHVRKVGINLIFIAQDFGSLEKKIRMLVHYVWTFKDLKTWPVPCVGGVFSLGRTLVGKEASAALPPPWCENIHSRQYHQKQFGMTRAEAVNKNQYVYRDPFVFHCYQSVSLHNSNIQMAGTAKDFGESGRIKRKGRKVKPIERILIYGLLIFAVWQSLKQPEPAETPVDTVGTQKPVKKLDTLPQEEEDLERLTMYIEGPDGAVLGTSERVYRLGEYLRDGRQVVGIGKRAVELKDRSGESEVLRF